METILDRPPYAGDSEGRFLPLWLAPVAPARSSSVINDMRSQDGVIE